MTLVFQNESSVVLVQPSDATMNISLQSEPPVVLVQDQTSTATIQTGIVLVGSTGSVSGPGSQAVLGNVPQWANSQGTALGPGLGVGTNPSNLVQLDNSARLPAVSGAQLFALPQPVMGAHPGGRLTLATGTPVMTSSVAGASAIYYTPSLGQCAPIAFDGATWTFVDIGGELSQALSDTTKSPAAAAASSLYDMFLWWDSSTAAFRCTRGPAWTNSTTRSLALTRMRGLQTNSAAITNGPAANFGLWVGTIATNASGTVDFIFGSQATNGGTASFGVWNTFNRADVRTTVADSTNTWSNTSSTVRAAHGSNTYRVSFVLGASEDAVYGQYGCVVQGITTNSTGTVGVGLDTTTAITGMEGFFNVASAAASQQYTVTGYNTGYPGIGAHFISANEAASTAGVNFYGSPGAGATYYGALVVQLRM